MKCNNCNSKDFLIIKLEYQEIVRYGAPAYNKSELINDKYPFAICKKCGQMNGSLIIRQEEFYKKYFTLKTKIEEIWDKDCFSIKIDELELKIKKLEKEYGYA